MIGQSISHYRILEKLGQGGMGEVYLARDSRLERQLAIKVVGPRLAADPTVRERLLSEARTASALNHPHICTIYEVGEVDGQSFIAMEYVAGEPLSRMIPEGGMATELVLRYGAQIADAVDHAHQHGIVHRDLKSSNVVVAEGGRAKVLDFGLAKQIDEEELETLTQTHVPLTRPGAIVGTLQYLAPEVLHGGPANARSDIWSLGVLLYELASGTLPFTGKSGYEISSAIQIATPAPLPPHVPPGLRAVVQRCLSKDPTQRYQGAGEIRAALDAISSGTDLQPDEIFRLRARQPWTTALVAVLAISALALGYLALRDRGSPGSATIPASAPMGQLRLLASSAGLLDDPVILPDGSTLAYVAEDGGRTDIFVRRIEGGKTIRLTDDPLHEHELEFSNRGDRIAFSRARPGRAREICAVPTLGGDIVPLAKDADIPSWSPDDQQLAFVQRAPDGAMQLAILDLRSGETRTLLRSDTDAELPFFIDLEWSPRGDILAVARGRGGIQTELWIVPVNGTQPYRLGEDPAEVFVDDPVFAPDGEAVIYSSNRAGATNLWRQPLDGSPAERLTSGTGPDAAPSVDASGAVVFLNARLRTGLFLFDLETSERRQLVSHDRFLWAPEFSPDGSEIAYSRGEIDGSWHVWSVGTTGAGNRQLTTGELPQILPRYFPDGQSLLYFTWSEEKDRVWTISREGGTARPLTPDNEFDDSYCDVSPDGEWIVFTRTLPSGPFMHVAPVVGGEARQITSEPSETPRWSPDGQWIAFSSSRGFDNGIWIVRPDGSDLRQLTHEGGWPTWWPDSRRVVYLVINEQARQEFWSAPLDGGAPVQIGPPSVAINNPVGISPDARSLAFYDEVRVASEIWMLEVGPAR